MISQSFSQTKIPKVWQKNAGPQTFPPLMEMGLMLRMLLGPAKDITAKYRLLQPAWVEDFVAAGPCW